MKNSSLLLPILFVLCACNMQSQKKECPLDGRTFKIENFVYGKSEGTELLTFKNGRAENDVCKQWGFTDATYTVAANCTFKYTLTSDKEGKMDWEGHVLGDKIEGKMVWVKAGQNDIPYTFVGQEVK